MNLITKAMSGAVLVALGLTLAVSAELVDAHGRY
jgi:hypothetical protein